MKKQLQVGAVVYSVAVGIVWIVFAGLLGSQSSIDSAYIVDTCRVTNATYETEASSFARVTWCYETTFYKDHFAPVANACGVFIDWTTANHSAHAAYAALINSTLSCTFSTASPNATLTTHPVVLPSVRRSNYLSLFILFFLAWIIPVIYIIISCRVDHIRNISNKSMAEPFARSGV